MIDHTQIKKGARIIIDGEPYEILWSMPLKKAQRRVVIQSKIKNLISGNVFERNFHQGDIFEEADLERFKAKFIYTHRDRYFFSKLESSSERFELTKEQIGSQIKFLKPNQEVEGITFEGKIINITLPIKIEIKVKDAPPAVKGDTAQGGSKIAILENGTEIAVPLFVQSGDIIEVNTEKEEYVRRL